MSIKFLTSFPIQQFHKVEDLHNVALTPNLVQNVMRSLPNPMELMSSFDDQFMEFRSKDPANFRSPATFKFLAQYVNKWEINYRSNPTLFNSNFSLMNIGMKPVRYEVPKKQERN